MSMLWRRGRGEGGEGEEEKRSGRGEGRVGIFLAGNCMGLTDLTLWNLLHNTEPK